MSMEQVNDRLVNFASDIDENTMEQAKFTSQLPFIFPHVALMPDAHLGKGATVGSVIPTKDAVIPAAVGVDIGCGMIAVRMIDRSEVPEPVGLMYYDPSKRTLRYRRKPNPSHGDTRQVEHRLLKKLAASERPDRYGHYETAAEYVAQREAMKGIGRALGTKMALRLQQLEQLQEPTEARRIQAQSKAFERVCDILSRHGYQISRWSRTEDLETRLKELDEALSSVVPTGTVDRETLYAISCLQQLRTTLGLQDRKEHGR